MTPPNPTIEHILADARHSLRHEPSETLRRIVELAQRLEGDELSWIRNRGFHREQLSRVQTATERR